MVRNVTIAGLLGVACFIGISMVVAYAGMAGWMVGGISSATALASVALIGYLIGRHQVRCTEEQVEARVEQTQEMIDQLDAISKQIRRSLATQHASIRVFREKVRALCEMEDEATRERLVAQAERILQPTAELSSEIASTYDTIRRETGTLKRMRESTAGMSR